MLPPLVTARFAVTNPRGCDGAMYVCQTNSYLWAWMVWRILCRGQGTIVKLKV